MCSKSTGPAGAYFRPTDQAPFSGLAQNLTRLIDEWRQAGLDPERIGALLAAAGLPAPKRRALAAAYQGYHQRLEPRWTDRPGLLQSLAADFSPAAWGARFAGVDLLLVAHFDAYPLLLQQLLSA